MTDEDYEYMKRCLGKGVADTDQQQDAADRIEELEANLEKALKALDAIRLYSTDGDAHRQARTTIAELTGGKDE